MRGLLSFAVVLVVLALGACGGDDSGSALDSALAYLPKDTPFAVALDTDVEGDQYGAVDDLLDEFPFGDQIRGDLLRELERSSGGVSFEEDVKPVLGNPLVVGAANAEAITADSGDFVVAGKAKDEGALGDLIDKLKPVTPSPRSRTTWSSSRMTKAS